MQPMVNIALRAARRAGQIIVRAMDRVDTLSVEEKAKNDLVSNIDRHAEAVIIETIMRAYPDHAILGEESGATNTDAEFTWIIDPLDGTSNYLKGIPHFCISIGITKGAALEHGVIVDPLRNEEFFASRGTGAQLNSKRLRITSTAKLDRSILATGMPYDKVLSHIDCYSDMLRSFYKESGSLRSMGSTALDLAYVAAGRTDGFFQIGLDPWDMAAGAVIVREAGGFVSDIAGGDHFMETGNLVAANPKIFKDLIKIIRTAVVKNGDDVLATG
jgi:myo-inositol-1(or 4)-monophosphatase